MKNMTKILLLLPMMAAAVCAQAQTRKVAPAGQDYTIGSVMAASGSNVTYQWFRNGVAIAGATGASYTVPALLAKHDNGLSALYTSGIKFQRAAYGIDCLGEAAMSNTVIVYFCELIVNGVCWARANADNVGRISSNPWDLGSFYQWNRPDVAYSATSPAVGVAVSGYPTPDYAATWTNGEPCPAGWRLPTQLDFENLHAVSQPAGGVWVTGGVRGVPVGTNGRFFGYNTDYCTISNMNGCVFLPAAGRRTNTGALAQDMGNYWANEQHTNSIGRSLYFSSTGVAQSSETSKSYALAIRCVIDVK